MKYYVYTLYCPKNKTIRYIGKTNDLRLRYNQHCSTIRGITRTINWIKHLKSLNLKPIMEVLEEYNNHDDCLLGEIYWISQFKQWNYELYNHTSGGEKGTTNPITDEHKLKIKNTLVERYKNQEHHLKGKSLSKEHKAKMSKSNNRIPSYGFKGKKHTTVRKKVQMTKPDNTIENFDSVLEGSIKYNINPGSISNNCLGKSKSAGGYKWNYI